jgi:predicted dehydrogenase
MDEAWELYEAKKQSKGVISIGFQPRFDENMRDICRVIESGVLGKVYYVQTGGGRRHGIPYRDTDLENTFVKDETAGIGAIGDIGCYSLDMVMNALGHPKPLTVTGYKSNLLGRDPEYYYFSRDKKKNSDEEKRRLADSFTVDDFGAAFIRLEGGIIIDFRIAWAMHLDTPGDTIIYGTKGSLRIPSTNCWNGSIGGPMTIYHEVAGKQVQTVLPLAPERKATAPTLWDMKIRTFLDAVKGLGDVPVPLEQILYNQAMVSGIVESSELGREVTLDFSKMEK